MARPRKKLDGALVEKLAQAQLTNVEIAFICGCEEKTLTRRFGERLKKWKEQGVGSVRRELYMTALGRSRHKGSAMIFFLKNYGGMADVIKSDVTAKHSGEVKVSHVDLSKLSDEQLAQVESLIESATPAASDSRTDQI